MAIKRDTQIIIGDSIDFLFTINQPMDEVSPLEPELITFVIKYNNDTIIAVYSNDDPNYKYSESAQLDGGYIEKIETNKYLVHVKADKTATLEEKVYTYSLFLVFPRDEQDIRGNTVVSKTVIEGYMEAKKVARD